jgi:hypothetical protein
MTGCQRDDTADAIANVAIDNWHRLLRVHHHRLRRADLEDCLSQATLELLTSAIDERVRFPDPSAVRAALETRLQSRIIDRQRALAGRSPITAALHHAAPIDPCAHTVAATIADPLATVLAREELKTLTLAAARALTANQRLVLRSQLDSVECAAEFCARHSWTLERYRKTAQRARTRLRNLTQT